MAPPSGNEAPTESQLARPLASAARLVEAVCRLPAIPVRDWCDRAAAAVGTIDPESIAVVISARISDDWSITEIEAAGVAVSSGIGGIPRPKHPPGLDVPKGRPGSGPRALLDSLRCSAAGLRRLGWAPPADPGPDGVAGLISRLGGPTWTDSGLKDLCDLAGGGDLLVGVVPFAPPAQRRFLAVYVGHARDESDGTLAEVQEWQTTVLASCLALLGRSAHAAMGTAATGKDRWISRREQAVLERLAAGMSVREVAAALDRSPHTVHDHLKSLHRKLAAKTRTELLARALGNWPPVMVEPSDHAAERPVADWTPPPSEPSPADSPR